MIHQLKIDTAWFVMKVDGDKHWELRFDDRGFMVDDYIGLNEVIDGKETGRFILERITAVVDDAPGICEGYVILSTETVYLELGINRVIRPPYGERNRIADGVITD